MNILVLNGSPKGKYSVTLQTVLYLEKLHQDIEFTYLNVGQSIKALEKDFTKAETLIKKADVLLFAYPVYTFLAPAQVHRFIELLKQSNIDFSGKIATQITTSKHFYDVTAHKYIEQNCMDLGIDFVRGLSSDMDDLLTEKGKLQARQYFANLLFSIKNQTFLPKFETVKSTSPCYLQCLKDTDKTKNYNVVILTNCSKEDTSLSNMITDFLKILPAKSKIVNINDFKFSAGCLGCLKCAFTGKCVQKDNFDEFLRTEVQSADSIVYAFTITDHYTGSSMKFYDDRQFCNGHRQVTEGMPIGYIISGNYKNEPNLQMVVEARSEVSGNYLTYIATDEENTSNELEKLANSLIYALDNHLTRPSNFYGVGGNKIFRDLVYKMQGIMKEDHKFYKKNGKYDFPQKCKPTIWFMKFSGCMMRNKKIAKKINMNNIVLMPYKKAIETATKSNN